MNLLRSAALAAACLLPASAKAALVDYSFDMTFTGGAYYVEGTMTIDDALADSSGNIMYFGTGGYGLDAFSASLYDSSDTLLGTIDQVTGGVSISPNFALVFNVADEKLADGFPFAWGRFAIDPYIFALGSGGTGDVGGGVNSLYIGNNATPAATTSLIGNPTFTRIVDAQVPLPAAAWLLLAGVGGLMGARRLRA